MVEALVFAPQVTSLPKLQLVISSEGRTANHTDEAGPCTPAGPVATVRTTAFLSTESL